MRAERTRGTRCRRWPPQSEAPPVPDSPDARPGTERPETDLVAREVPLQIDVGEQTVALRLRSPGAEDALAVGFLLSTGLVRRREDLRQVAACGGALPRVRVDLQPELEERVAVWRARQGAAGIGPATGDPLRAVLGDLPRPPEPATPDPEALAAMLDRLRAAQELHRQTGCAHGMALFDGRCQLLTVAEDVSRHNALDKALGRLLLDGRLPQARICVASSRSSYEIVMRVLRAGLGTLASAGAPTRLAVDLAREAGLELIAYLSRARHTRFSPVDAIE